VFYGFVDRRGHAGNPSFDVFGRYGVLLCEEHARYLDLVEKRDEQWKILKQHCLYDMGTFTFPFGSVDIDRAAASRHPREYAALAYLLEKSGFPVARRFPTRGSDAEKAIRILADAWLEG
jgi:hypothetical protein